MINIETSEYAIDLTDVAKTYKGGVQALRGIEMRVHHGEIFGLLGPNGAGKSTLVKILMTIVRPLRCEGSLLGQAVGTRDVLANVGYLPEHLQFPPYLTADQALDLYGALGKVPRAARRKRANDLLELVGMRDWSSKRIGTYSKGMKQRVGLAQALMNDPDLVVLDEPTDGVDPVGRRDIRNLLTELRNAGKTVFVNSHLLGEVEMICDRVAILSQGLVVKQGTIDELTSHSSRYELTLGSRPTVDGELAGLMQRLEATIDDTEGRVRISVPSVDPSPIQPLIDHLRRANVVIESVQPVRESLEDFFIEVVSNGNSDATDPPGKPSKQGGVD